MLIRIDHIRSNTGFGNIIYYYRLIDDKFEKIFDVICSTNLSSEDQQIKIANSVFEFIHEEYKYSKYCVFSLIKKLYNSGNLLPYNDDIYRKTIFYKKNKKNMDRALILESYRPTYDFVGGQAYNNQAFYTYTATTTNNTFTLRYPTFTVRN